MTSVKHSHKTLSQWLQYIEALHPKSIAMGLDRVSQVKQRLGLDPSFPIITVAGTNGKGSTCAMINSIYHEANYRVASYSSPHLLRYNERVSLGCEEVSDQDLCTAFLAVEEARQDTELTYFEFGTLAAMWHFMQCDVDVAVLEVGLGGRLDAVNIFESDCSIVTSVDLDHIEFLGDSRESIGFEKAGVFRRGKPAICGDIDPPQRLISHAKAIEANLMLSGEDFSWQHAPHSNVWNYQFNDLLIQELPIPALAGDFQLSNAACALTVITILKYLLPVDRVQIEKGLSNVRLSGRFQQIKEEPLVIVDVAHNPHAAIALAENLRIHPSKGKTFAVFSMLSDKDIEGVVLAVTNEIDSWYVAGINHVRGAKADQLESLIRKCSLEAQIKICDDVLSAYHQACFDASENDRIIAFGSFFTVADVLRQNNDSR